MRSWELLLLVPMVPVVVLGLLVLTAWIEERMLSPRALVVRAARARSDPEVSEQVVTVESAHLLPGDRQR